MNFIVGAEKGLAFYQEETAFTVVNKIADKVRKDVQLVAGFMAEITQSRVDLGMYSVIYGTVGRSPVLDELNEKGIIDLSLIEGKREVYVARFTAYSIFPSAWGYLHWWTGQM